MAHLDDDVAAFVDGQLPPAATDAARCHLQDCDHCRTAVEQQRQLKSRVRTVSAPEPPPGLLASLSSVPRRPPPPLRPWWTRAWRSAPLGAGVVMLGASLAVAMTAWLAGATDDVAGDVVAPPFDQYVTDFVSGSPTATGTLSVAALESLDEQGWPCHATLAGDLERVDGRWHDGTGTVALTYSDGRDRLRLYEQNGTLQDSALAGFRRDVVGGREIWVRTGQAQVVTWDADGVVYTVVSDVDDRRLAEAVRELPEPRRPKDVAERLDDGLGRMATWLTAA